MTLSILQVSVSCAGSGGLSVAGLCTVQGKIEPGFDEDIDRKHTRAVYHYRCHSLLRPRP